MDHDTFIRTCSNMERSGGSFAAHIAKAGFKADLENRKKLLEAFPELFSKFSNPIWD